MASFNSTGSTIQSGCQEHSPVRDKSAEKDPDAHPARSGTMDAPAMASNGHSIDFPQAQSRSGSLQMNGSGQQRSQEAVGRPTGSFGVIRAPTSMSAANRRSVAVSGIVLRVNMAGLPHSIHSPAAEAAQGRLANAASLMNLGPPRPPARSKRLSPPSTREATSRSDAAADIRLHSHHAGQSSISVATHGGSKAVVQCPPTVVHSAGPVGANGNSNGNGTMALPAEILSRSSKPPLPASASASVRPSIEVIECIRIIAKRMAELKQLFVVLRPYDEGDCDGNGNAGGSGSESGSRSGSGSGSGSGSKGESKGIEGVRDAHKLVRSIYRGLQTRLQLVAPPHIRHNWGLLLSSLCIHCLTQARMAIRKIWSKLQGLIGTDVVHPVTLQQVHHFFGELTRMDQLAAKWEVIHMTGSELQDHIEGALSIFWYAFGYHLVYQNIPKAGTGKASDFVRIAGLSGKTSLLQTWTVSRTLADAANSLGLIPTNTIGGAFSSSAPPGRLVYILPPHESVQGGSEGPSVLHRPHANAWHMLQSHRLGIALDAQPDTSLVSGQSYCRVMLLAPTLPGVGQTRLETRVMVRAVSGSQIAGCNPQVQPHRGQIADKARSASADAGVVSLRRAAASAAMCFHEWEPSISSPGLVEPIVVRIPFDRLVQLPSVARISHLLSQGKPSLEFAVDAGRCGAVPSEARGLLVCQAIGYGLLSVAPGQFNPLLSQVPTSDLEAAAPLVSEALKVRKYWTSGSTSVQSKLGTAEHRAGLMVINALKKARREVRTPILHTGILCCEHEWESRWRSMDEEKLCMRLMVASETDPIGHRAALYFHGDGDLAQAQAGQHVMQETGIGLVVQRHALATVDAALSEVHRQPWLPAAWRVLPQVQQDCWHAVPRSIFVIGEGVALASAGQPQTELRRVLREIPTAALHRSWQMWLLLQQYPPSISLALAVAGFKTPASAEPVDLIQALRTGIELLSPDRSRPTNNHLQFIDALWVYLHTTVAGMHTDAGASESNAQQNVPVGAAARKYMPPSQIFEICTTAARALAGSVAPLMAAFEGWHLDPIGNITRMLARTPAHPTSALFSCMAQASWGLASVFGPLLAGCELGRSKGVAASDFGQEAWLHSVVGSYCTADGIDRTQDPREWGTVAVRGLSLSDLRGREVAQMNGIPWTLMSNRIATQVPAGPTEGGEANGGHTQSSDSTGSAAMHDVPVIHGAAEGSALQQDVHWMLSDCPSGVYVRGLLGCPSTSNRSLAFGWGKLNSETTQWTVPAADWVHVQQADQMARSMASWRDGMSYQWEDRVRRRISQQQRRWERAEDQFSRGLPPLQLGVMMQLVASSPRDSIGVLLAGVQELPSLTPGHDETTLDENEQSLSSVVPGSWLPFESNRLMQRAFGAHARPDINTTGSIEWTAKRYALARGAHRSLSACNGAGEEWLEGMVSAMVQSLGQLPECSISGAPLSIASGVVDARRLLWEEAAAAMIMQQDLDDSESGSDEDACMLDTSDVSASLDADRMPRNLFGRRSVERCGVLQEHRRVGSWWETVSGTSKPLAVAVGQPELNLQTLLPPTSVDIVSAGSINTLLPSSLPSATCSPPPSVGITSRTLAVQPRIDDEYGRNTSDGRPSDEAISGSRINRVGGLMDVPVEEASDSGSSPPHDLHATTTTHLLPGVPLCDAADQPDLPEALFQTGCRMEDLLELYGESLVGRRVVVRGPLPLRLASLGDKTTSEGAADRLQARSMNDRRASQWDGPLAGSCADAIADSRDVSVESPVADALREQGLVRHDLPGARQGVSPEWYRGSWSEPQWRQCQVEAYNPEIRMHLVVFDAVLPHAADEGEEVEPDTVSSEEVEASISDGWDAVDEDQRSSKQLGLIDGPVISSSEPISSTRDSEAPLLSPSCSAPPPADFFNLGGAAFDSAYMQAVEGAQMHERLARESDTLRRLEMSVALRRAATAHIEGCTKSHAIQTVADRRQSAGSSADRGLEQVVDIAAEDNTASDRPSKKRRRNATERTEDTSGTATGQAEHKPADGLGPVPTNLASDTELRTAMSKLQSSNIFPELATAMSSWASELVDRPIRGLPAVWVDLHALLLAAPGAVPVHGPTGKALTTQDVRTARRDPRWLKDDDSEDFSIAITTAASGTASMVFRPQLRHHLQQVIVPEQEEPCEPIQRPKCFDRIASYSRLCRGHSAALLVGERPMFGLQQTPNTCRRLVACSRCKDWFVAASIGLTAAATAALGSDWLCPCCVAYAHRGALRRSAHLWRLSLLWSGHLQDEKAIERERGWVQAGRVHHWMQQGYAQGSLNREGSTTPPDSSDGNVTAQVESCLQRTAAQDLHPMAAAPWLPPYCGADDLLAAHARMVHWSIARASEARSSMLQVAAKALPEDSIRAIVARMVADEEPWLLELGESKSTEASAGGAQTAFVDQLKQTDSVDDLEQFLHSWGGKFHKLNWQEQSRCLFGPRSAWGDGDLPAVASAAMSLCGHGARGHPVPVAPYVGLQLRRSLLELRRVRHRRAPWPSALSSGPQWCVRRGMGVGSQGRNMKLSPVFAVRRPSAVIAAALREWLRTFDGRRELARCIILEVAAEQQAVAEAKRGGAIGNVVNPVDAAAAIPVATFMDSANADRDTLESIGVGASSLGHKRQRGSATPSSDASMFCGPQATEAASVCALGSKPVTPVTGTRNAPDKRQAAAAARAAAREMDVGARRSVEASLRAVRQGTSLATRVLLRLLPSCIERLTWASPEGAPSWTAVGERLVEQSRHTGGSRAVGGTAFLDEAGRGVVYSDPQRVARRQLRLTVEQGALRVGNRTSSRRRDGVDGGGAEAAGALAAESGVSSLGGGLHDTGTGEASSRLQAAVEDSDSDDWEWLGGAARGPASWLSTQMQRNPPSAAVLRDPPAATRWIRAMYDDTKSGVDMPATDDGNASASVGTGLLEHPEDFSLPPDIIEDVLGGESLIAGPPDETPISARSWRDKARTAAGRCKDEEVVGTVSRIDVADTGETTAVSSARTSSLSTRCFQGLESSEHSPGLTFGPTFTGQASAAVGPRPGLTCFVTMPLWRLVPSGTDVSKPIWECVPYSDEIPVGIGGSLQATSGADPSPVAEQCAPLPVPTYSVQMPSLSGADNGVLQLDPTCTDELLISGWGVTHTHSAAAALLQAMTMGADRECVSKLSLPSGDGKGDSTIAVSATLLSLATALEWQESEHPAADLTPLWPPALLMIPIADTVASYGSEHEYHDWLVAPLPSRFASERLRQSLKPRELTGWPFDALVILLPSRGVTSTGGTGQPAAAVCPQFAEVIHLQPLVDHSEPPHGSMDMDTAGLPESASAVEAGDKDDDDDDDDDIDTYTGVARQGAWQKWDDCDAIQTAIMEPPTPVMAPDSPSSDTSSVVAIDTPPALSLPRLHPSTALDTALIDHSQIADGISPHSASASSASASQSKGQSRALKLLCTSEGDPMMGTMLAAIAQGCSDTNSNGGQRGMGRRRRRGRQVEGRRSNQEERNLQDAGVGTAGNELDGRDGENAVSKRGHASAITASKSVSMPVPVSAFVTGRNGDGDAAASVRDVRSQDMGALPTDRYMHRGDALGVSLHGMRMDLVQRSEMFGVGARVIVPSHPETEAAVAAELAAPVGPGPLAVIASALVIDASQSSSLSVSDVVSDQLLLGSGSRGPLPSGSNQNHASMSVSRRKNGRRTSDDTGSPLERVQRLLQKHGCSRVLQVAKWYRSQGLSTARLVRMAVRGRRNAVQCIRLVRSGIEGYGAAAAHPLRAGDAVVEYRGEVVRMAAGNRREALYEHVARFGSDYMFRNSRDTVLDATVAGSSARFLNHSCTPNCGTKLRLGKASTMQAVPEVRAEELEAVGDAAVAAAQEMARQSSRTGRIEREAVEEGEKMGSRQEGVEEGERMGSRQEGVGEGQGGVHERMGEDPELGRAVALGMVRACAEGNASFVQRNWDASLLPAGDASTRVRIDVGSRMVHAGEELCYDYKFPLEHFDSRRIQCSCGTPLCTGHMN